MVLATAQMGIRLYDRESWLLSALLVAGAHKDSIHLSAAARPDQLYATLCLLQLFAWCKPPRKRGSPSGRGCCLSAGALPPLPAHERSQVPVFFFLGCSVCAVWTAVCATCCAQYVLPRRHRAPMSHGASWWSVILTGRTNSKFRSRRPNFPVRFCSALLLGRNCSVSYYLGRGSSSFFPRAFSCRSRSKPCPQMARRNPATRLLIAVSIVTLVIFTWADTTANITSNRFFPLPFTSPLMRLSYSSSTRSAPLAQSSTIAVALGGAFCVGLAAYRHVYWVSRSRPLYAALLVRFWKSRRRPLLGESFPLRQVGSLAIQFRSSSAHSTHSLPMSTWRDQQQSFAKKVSSALTRDDSSRLGTRDSISAVLRQAARAVCMRLQCSGQGVLLKAAGWRALYVVTPLDHLPPLASRFQLQTLCQTHYASRKKADPRFASGLVHPCACTVQ
jgi:hypothetical protein